MENIAPQDNNQIMMMTTREAVETLAVRDKGKDKAMDERNVA